MSNRLWLALWIATLIGRDGNVSFHTLPGDLGFRPAELRGAIRETLAKEGQHEGLR
ncbi:MAG: hypothetical protein NTW28_25785 [Candidatus Solibacter sp.]|nr:hypothetical protein [Candidatus Solibacter sp.]